MPLKDLPLEAQPREKLLARGPGALSDAELLQLKNDSASRNNDGRQGGFEGIAGLLHATADDLKCVKGLGPAFSRHNPPSKPLTGAAPLIQGFRP
jgi:DNA repair protein RadC